MAASIDLLILLNAVLLREDYITVGSVAQQFRKGTE